MAQVRVYGSRSGCCRSGNNCRRRFTTAWWTLCSSRATSVHDRVGIAPQDVEICIQESPACNWGFRGLHGDEATLNYFVKL